MKKKLPMLSELALTISLLIWIISIIFEVNRGYVFTTIFIGAFGVICSLLSKRYWFALFNFLMAISVFIVMFVGYFIEYLKH